MGIQDLYDVINAECPEVLITIHLSELMGLKVAVDISIFLNKFVKTAGPERWLENFIMLLCCLKRHGIKPVCIFDGPKPPPEKKAEQDRRRAEAAKKAEKIKYGRRILKKLEEEYLPEERAPGKELVAEIKSIVGVRRGKNVDTINYYDIYDVVVGLKEVIARQERQNQPILPIYSAQAKQIIEIMGFAYFQADGEAETLCAAMCCIGLVDAVLSEDTDVLAYGTPFLLSKVDLAAEKVTIVSIEAILENMELSYEEFRDLCILLGCDYNDRIKGYPPDGKKRKKPVCVGAKGAVLMIREYRNLETAEGYIEDADPLLYRRCRELFTVPAALPHITIPYNRAIDERKLVAFLKEHRIRTSINYILDTWKPTEVVCEEDDEVFSDDGSDVDDEEPEEDDLEEPYEDDE